MLEGISAAGFVLLLLAAVVWKFGRPRSCGGFLPSLHRAPGSLRAAERLRLTPQHSVYIVEAAGRRMLVGCHSTGMVLLAEISESVSEPIAIAARRTA